MKYFSTILTFIVFALLLQSCNVQTSENTNIKTLFISADRKDCDYGSARMKCMLVKEKPTDQWQYFYGNIDGFSYEDGYDYTLTVKTEKIENPPADASSIKYTLVKQIAKIKR